MFPSLPRVVLASSFLVVSGSLVVSAPETASRPVLSEFLGLNGHTVQFKPDLYQPVGRLVRDYHPVQWDLGDEPSKPPQFPLARNKVDWNQVYGSWKKAGWETEACLMFESVDRAKWKDLPGEARAYGKAFAEAFGPSGTRKLVRAVEIGNEPGSWSDEDYATMFRAMAEGLRSGDPALRIATCNLTASGSGKYEKSVRCIEGLLPLVDVLTIHTYPMLEQWPTWKRSFPEDPRLPRYLPDVAALCRWRDQKAPGKPVWITEFGYDACTQPPPADGDFKQWTDVTDARQAQWLVRSVLVFSSLPVERAYIYFFNDDDKPGLHASSGLTRHFQPNPKCGDTHQGRRPGSGEDLRPCGILRSRTQ